MLLRLWIDKGNVCAIVFESTSSSKMLVHIAMSHVFGICQ